ncbi:MAG TPA: SET domain-containing protein-lysine N-methyltransferase [Rhizomicrobium sp.]
MEKIVYVRIPGKGRGIIAKAPIAAGELIERSPVLPIGSAESECPGLNDYSFAWGEDVEGFEPGKECAVGLGYLSLYNHSDTSNVSLTRHYEENEMSIHALRDIAAGEELTINYDVPLWFEEAKS